eukprot:g1502.t1
MASSPVHPKTASSSSDQGCSDGAAKSPKNSQGSLTSKLSNMLVSRPYVALTIIIAVAGFLCVGLHKWELEKDIDDLWIEDGSIVGKEMQYEKDHKYKTWNSDTQLATIVPLGDPDHNSMTRNILDKHLKFAQRVADISFDHNGHTYKYEDVCASVSKYRVSCQRVTALDCFKEGAFDFTPYNAIYALQGVLNVVAQSLVDTVLLTLGTDGLIEQTEDGMVSQVEAVMISGAESETLRLTEEGMVAGALVQMVDGSEAGMISQAEAGLVTEAEAGIVTAAKAGGAAQVEAAMITGFEDSILSTGCTVTCQNEASTR